MKQKLLVSIVLVAVLSSVTGSAVPFTIHDIRHNTYSDAIFEEVTSHMNRISSGWPQIFDEGAEDAPMGGLAIDSQGNVIVTGYAWDIVTNESNILTLKYDRNGNELWKASFNSSIFELPWDIAVDSQDNIVVFGINATSLADFEELKIDFILVKYNSDGVEQWTKYYKNTFNGFPGGGAVDSHDNIIFTGAIGNFDATDYSGWTVKLDKDGGELWNCTFRDDLINFCSDATVDSNDNIIVGGVYGSFFGFGYCCVKYDSDGNKQWVKRYSGGNEPRSIALDSDDNIILTGTNYSTVTETVTGYTIKCDNTGELLWKQDYDSGSHDLSANVAVDSQGNIITVGYSSFSIENNTEHCTIIYDTNGKELCLKRPGIPGILYGVAVDSSDTIFVTGNIRGDYYTDKYIDVTPPASHVEKPSERTLYIFDKNIISLPKNTVIIGDITVKLEADDPSDVDKVEFYLDHHLRDTLSQQPYEWVWDETTFGKHTITTMAYDAVGNIARNEITVWRFF